MSRFYGTVTSDKGTSTRAGHRHIRASAQSREGSVSVEIIEPGIVVIDVQEASGTGGRQLLRVTLADLVHAGGLAIKKEKA